MNISERRLNDVTVIDLEGKFVLGGDGQFKRLVTTNKEFDRPTQPLAVFFCRKEILMSVKLYVGNLAYETTSDELNALFSEVGQVDSCNLIIDRDTDRSKGFAFIEMDSKESANAAKEKLNGQDLHGRALKVNEAKPRNESRNNGGGDSRRY
jgi:cold-inducible RNA-binding protein